MVPSAAWDSEVDLIVVGTGAAGLSAATTGALLHLKTLVLEKTEYVGGTTAYSAGTSWVPGHGLQPAAFAEHDRRAASEYLDTLVGSKTSRVLRETYLDHAPETMNFYRANGVNFLHSKSVVDYHPEIAGSGIGRALEPAPFDARKMRREDFRRIRPPVPEFALFGGTLMVRRTEVNELLGIFSFSPRAFVTAFRLGIRWCIDRLFHHRGTRLTMGNALIANLFQVMRSHNGEAWLNSTVKELVLENQRVVGAVVESEGRQVRVRARRGVVLAGGGFPANHDWRKRHLPDPAAQFSRAAEGASGETIQLGLDAGAVLGADHGDNAFWFPSSIGRRADGSLAVFPHIWDRAKPGVIAIGLDGNRFVDESVSYHRFVRAMYDNAEVIGSIATWLITDAASLRKYGLGMIRPGTPAFLVSKYVRRGYIHRARTLTDLAQKIGVEPTALIETVKESNNSAVTGKDLDFGKGESEFGLQYGDPGHLPNANLGPIGAGPFYALPVVPTPLATSLGLQIDSDGRVLNETGQPIPGLYACGNDADSITASEYPGAGCQVGAGLTFGHLAAKHAASLTPEGAPRPLQRNDHHRENNRN